MIKSILTQYLSFYFVQLLFSKTTKRPEWCLIYIFDGSSRCLGKHPFHFSSTFGNNLIDFLISNFVNIICGSFNNTRCNLSSLINCVSTRISKVITTMETSTLPFASSACIASFLIMNFVSFYFLPSHV